MVQLNPQLQLKYLVQLNTDPKEEFLMGCHVHYMFDPEPHRENNWIYILLLILDMSSHDSETTKILQKVGGNTYLSQCKKMLKSTHKRDL